MPNLALSSLTLRVGVQTVSCQLTQGFWNPKQTLLAYVPLPLASQHPKNESFPDLMGLLRESLAPISRSMTATVVLSDAYVRFFIVTPPQNPLHIKDFKAAAAMRFQALYGERNVEWQLDAAWTFKAPFIACAIHNDLGQLIKNLGREYHLNVVQIVPQFVIDWNTYHSQFQSNSWFASFHENRLTLGIFHKDVLCAIHSTYVSEHACNTKEWLSEQVLREALQLNIPKPESIQLVGESIPELWLRDNSQDIVYIPLNPLNDSDQDTSGAPEIVAYVVPRGTSIKSVDALDIDFAQSSYARAFYTTSYFSLVFCCLALFLFGYSTFHSFTLLKQFQQVKIASQDLQLQVMKSKRRSSMPKPTVISAAQAQAINQAVQQLNIPWHDMFNAIEQATPKTIALLALEPNTKNSRLKGVAEAKSFGDMISYIEQLKQHVFFKLVILTRHEISESDVNKPIRFQFEAYWSEDVK